MTRPLLILDQHFRKLEELFRPTAFDALAEMCEIAGGRNWPMDASRIDALIGQAAFLVAARPCLTADQIARAPNLRAVIEVSGAFHGDLDYAACFERGIEVLSCVPAFRYAVAEMAVAMILAGARGLVDQHEAFRTGRERWVEDLDDFSLYGQTVGFIGYGQIARETHRLLAPFDPVVSAHDPWLAAGDVQLSDLPTLVRENRVVVVAAAPTDENRHMLDADLIDQLQPGALVVVISRAHCVDFAALMAAAATGRIRVATDVFPSEPVAPDDPMRRNPNVIFSPHRAAAVPGGRHPIGDMVLHDVRAILDGNPARELRAADPDHVARLVAGQRAMEAKQ